MEWALSISKEEYIKHAEQVLKEFGLDPDTFMYSIEVTAEDYISRGYSIIPIAITKEGTGLEKKPLIRWKEYQNRRATMDEVRKWINEFKYFNIAIVTGKVSNLTVIDIDDKKIEEKFDKIKTAIVETGKGYQIYILGGRESKVICKDPDIRVKGDGGYVLAPPSVHPSGKLYRFLFGYDLDKISSDFDGILAIIKRFYKVEDKEERLVLSETEAEFEKPPLSYPCFVQAHKETPEGTRNETLFALGMMLYAQGFAPDYIWEYLKWFNKKYCKPPLDEKEVKNICKSIFKHGYIPTCKAIMKRLKPDCRGCVLNRFKKVEVQPEEEVMVKDEELEKYLPEGYDLFRDYQVQLIRDLKKALESGSAALNAPTGAGKTLVYYVVSRMLGVPTVVVLPNRALQDQVKEYGIVVVKGRANYICPIIGDKANLAPCVMKRNYKCDKECEYKIALEVAKKELEENGIVAVNFGNWWIFKDYLIGEDGVKIGLLVLDEAHLVVKYMSSPVRVKSNKIEDIKAELESLVVEREKLLDKLDMVSEKSEEYTKLAKEVDKIEQRIRKLRWLLQNEKYLLFYKKGDDWYAIVEEMGVINWLISKFRCLFVSATLPELPNITVVRSDKYITTRKNAPIVYFPIEKLTKTAYRKKGPAIFKLAANIIKMISNYYGENKVVVHVMDIDTTGREIARYLQPYKVKIHEKGSVDKTIEEFKRDDSRFLILAQMDTGLDFTFVRLQFIVNLPYANRGDPIWKAKAEKYGYEKAMEEYERTMVNKLIQLCGRVCRGRGDTGITIILDRKFGEVFEKHKDWFPEDFKNRLIFLTKSED